MQEMEEPEFAGELESYELTEADIAAILADYQRRQFMVHMTGPIVSLVLHVIVLTAASLLITGESKRMPEELEVTIEEIPITELEEPVIEELEEIDEDISEAVPEVDTPAPPTDDITETELEDVSDDAPEVESPLDLDEVLDVEMTASPMVLTGYYGGRSSGSMRKMVRRGGGSASGQNSVSRALKWLQSVQNADGSWPGHQGVPMSGFALLCFLAHGETPLSEEYGETVQKGIQFLASKMTQTMEGNPKATCGGRAYSHGIATYALAEAYGMTRIPFLRTAMELGVQRIIDGQQPPGGFDYHYKYAFIPEKGKDGKPVLGPDGKPKLTNKRRWDLSVAGWQVQALKAAYVAGAQNQGLEQAIDKSVKWLKTVTYANKKFGYSTPGSGGNMTGVGVVALQLLGEGKSPQAQGGCETIATERLLLYKKILENGAEWPTTGGNNLYGFYYDTQAMFNSGGRHWRDWSKAFEITLIRSQNHRGYWETLKGHGHDGDSVDKLVMTTALACLQLEVYYRYLPTFDIHKMEQHKVTGNSIDELDTGGGVILH